MSIDTKLLQRILEGALLAAAKPLTVAQLAELFEDDERPDKDVITAALEDIQAECKDRGFELKEVSSGFRFQVIQDVSQWVSRLWDEKPQKYSRALLETLALIAYRQPITRGDIEDIRGVAVSSNIIKTLLEREWVRVVGHKDVPGRPAMYATTRRFLDYFNLKNLENLPSLAEIRDLDSMNEELALEGADTEIPEDNDDQQDQGDGDEIDVVTESDQLDIDDANSEVDSESAEASVTSDENSETIEGAEEEQDSVTGDEPNADTASDQNADIESDISI